MRYSRQNRIAMAAGQSHLDNMTDPAYEDDRAEPEEDYSGKYDDMRDAKGLDTW